VTVERPAVLAEDLRERARLALRRASHLMAT
jgi:hypothetical protein